MTERHYAGVIIKGGKDRYMLAHHAMKKERPWRFPGGKIENGELAICAAARELWEEHGISAESLTFVTETHTEIDGGVWVGHYFLLGDYQGEISLMEPEKIDDWSFFSAQEIFEMGPEAEGDKLRELLIALNNAQLPNSTQVGATA